jgi:hypothetical protein
MERDEMTDTTPDFILGWHAAIEAAAGRSLTACTKHQTKPRHQRVDP